MLINTQKFDKGDIIAMKLVNGDEVVAQVVADEMMAYTVSRPCTVMPSPKGIGLMQSLLTSDLKQNISISKQHVMMAAAVIDEMKNHYIQTTTGIQPVSAGGVFG
jgi:hypothetical protein